MKNIYIEKANQIVGSQARLANLLGLKSPTVSQWLSGDRPVPPIQCVLIEQLTNGEVTRKQLRPDDWESIWPELKEVA